MQPFSVTLADGAKINVVQKISGRKRSIKLIFFKIRRRKQLIAYSVKTQEQNSTHYTIYKVKNTGLWQRGVDSDDALTKDDHKRALEIKSAIDEFESAISPYAYKDLF